MVINISSSGITAITPIQTLTFSGVTGGSFTLALGASTTAAIPYSATATTLAGNIQAALNGLAAIGAGGTSVSVTGSTATVTFLTTPPGTVLPTLAANVSSLTGTSPAVNGAITNAGGGDMVIASSITGVTVGFTKMGAGILTYAGTTPNTFNGSTNVNEGTLWLAKQAAGAAALGGPVVVGDFNGTEVARVMSNFSQLNGQNIYVAGSGTLDLGSGTNVGQTIGSLTVNGGVVSTGSNTLTLGGDVTATAIGTQTATVTGLLDLGTANRTFSVLDNGSTPGLNLQAVISSAGGTFGINKQGAGTMNLGLGATAANTYTGTTNVNEGTLVLDNTAGVAVPGNLVVGDFIGGSGVNKADVLRIIGPNQISSTTAVTVNNSGLLDLNGFADSHRLRST